MYRIINLTSRIDTLDLNTIQLGKRSAICATDTSTKFKKETWIIQP